MVDNAKMADFARRELDLEAAELSASYFYHSLPICVVDAVFSMGVRYVNALNVVERLCKKTAILKFRAANSDFPARDAQFTVSQCLEHIGGASYEDLAAFFFENWQRTSTKKGILKAEAVVRFLNILDSHGVQTFQDLADCDLSGIEAKIREIPGQASGKCWRYFLMLAGDDNQVKPDRMIMRFLERFADGSESLSPEGAHVAIVELSAHLRGDFPHLTPRLLDHAIWRYESGRTGAQEKGKAKATDCRQPLAS